MELIKALAIGLHEDDALKGAWPEPATQFEQTSTWGGDFDIEVTFGDYESSYFEFENGPFMEEYDSGETVTKEEYVKFLADYPDWYENMLAERPALIAKIAELNKQVGALVNQMSQLANQAGVDISINLGQYGSLDPNSDWDSSRC